MRWLKTLILLTAALLAPRVEAAIAATAQWDVRTTGSNNNGGFFVSGLGGTDFSQQNSAQYTFSDLASSNATTTCVVTSASHNFVAADVGNAMHISAGTNWTTGWYEIISAAANAATLDRACGSVASVSAGTYFVGGSLLTMDQANSNLVAGNVVNVQSGTYTRTTTLALTVQATWVGYQTAHLDYAAKPLVTTSTNSTDLLSASNGAAGTVLDNFTFTNTAVTPAIGLVSVTSNSTMMSVRNCSFSGFTNGINGDNVGAHFEFTRLFLSAVEIKNSTADGLNISASIVWVDASWLHDNTGAGIINTSSGSVFTVTDSIISGNGTKGISLSSSGSYLALVNSAVANNTSDGVFGSSTQYMVSNSIIYGNGAFGINGNSANLANSGRNNAYGSNTSGPRNNFPTSQGDIALTANPFTSSTNFALNNTAGGGAALAGLGYPGTFPGGTTVGTINVGPVQSAGGGGGGGTTTAKTMNATCFVNFQ